MKILAPLFYASVQRPSAWSFMVIRVKKERKDAFKECLMFLRILSVYPKIKFVSIREIRLIRCFVKFVSFVV